MNLSIIDKKIDEPFYFHREYKNDIHQTEQQGNEEASASWLQLSQRIAFASLPFFSLYKPFSMPIALVMGSVRVYSSASELYSLIQEGDTQKISKGVIQTAIAVTALAGTILAHPIGMLVTTGQDIVIDCGYVIHHLNEGDYKKAAERTASLVNNALYLSLFVAGSLELSIASVTVQVLLGAYNSSEDFQKGRWIEGSAHILMAAIRTNQLRGQIQALQQRNEFEQKIKDFIKQSDETKKKMQPKSSSEDIGNHVSKRIMSERVVASHSGNKMLIRNTSLQNANKDISDILIEYGNNPLKIPAINYAAHLGKEDVVKLLLQHGANANQHSMRGSPLEIALAAGHRHLVPLFLEYKVTVTANAASSCCKHHFLNELQLLMKINQSEICTSKVVTDCCEYAFLEGLELLFENGATIPSNFTNDQVLYKWLSKGETKFVPIVKFLIKRGANCQYYINASRIQIDKKHNTPSWSLFICSGGLLVPALDFDDPELIELLIKNKAPLNAHVMGNILGISDASLFKKIAYLDPLYKATMQGKFEVVDLLIKSGSIRNEEIGKSFNNAMIIETRSLDSLSEKEFNKIKKMVDLGFLSQDLFFHQMMWSSISSKNDIKWVKSLFDLGAQTRDYYLTWAIEKKNKDIVTFLLEQGAKP